MSESITPKSRKERFMAKIAGGQDEIEPKSRTEKFMNKIAESNSGLILDLYVADDDFYADKPPDPAVAYKDPELEQSFESYEEALAAVMGSAAIRVHDEATSVFFAYCFDYDDSDSGSVIVCCNYELHDGESVVIRSVSLSIASGSEDLVEDPAVEVVEAP